MATYTKNRIYQFRKTNHFIQQAFNRGIDDEILKCVLKFYQDHDKGKIIALFVKDTLLKNNIKPLNASHLIIVIKYNHLLITAFWCKDLKNYFKNQKCKNQKIVKFPENIIINKHNITKI